VSEVTPTTGANPDLVPASAWWRRPVGVHLALYALVLVALSAVGPVNGLFTSDEGAYLVQLELLDDGGWAFDYPLAEADPEGTWLPIINSDQGSGGEWFPYVKHPLYVHLLDASTGLLGVGVGAHVWSVLGALAAAAAAWYLARELDASLAPAAFWLAALGPLLPNAQMIWAHTLSAALGGWAAWLALRAVRADRIRVPTALAVTVLLVLGVLIRTEGLLWAGALVAALAVHAWRGRRASWVWALGLMAVASLAAFVVQRAWRLSIVGETVSTVPDSSSDSLGAWVGDRTSAATAILVKGAEIEPAATTVVLVALGCVLLAGVVWRTGRSTAVAHVLVVAAVVLYAVRIVAFDADPIIGLLAAWPIVVLALVVWRPVPDDGVRLLVVAVALFAATVVISQWGEAGGVQWGGRYLSPALPVVAACAALSLQLGLRRPRADGIGSRRRFPVPLLAALVLVPAVAAAVVPEQLRLDHTELVADATASGQPVVISGQGSIPRFAWDTTDDITWYHLPPGEPLAPLLEALADSGLDEVAVVSVPVDDADLAGWVVASDEGGVSVLRADG
jgi:hypothetical protein